ncbi:MAG: hypothetical protein KatS3mg032_1810 [Cyclobacteriaceae bacterium]|nr:MAG: hypothetical protein KatS3mg032_1810 [Cyclobacteriaceae bacterium]
MFQGACLVRPQKRVFRGRRPATEHYHHNHPAKDCSLRLPVPATCPEQIFQWSVDGQNIPGGTSASIVRTTTRIVSPYRECSRLYRIYRTANRTFPGNTRRAAAYRTYLQQPRQPRSGYARSVAQRRGPTSSAINGIREVYCFRAKPDKPCWLPNRVYSVWIW